MNVKVKIVGLLLAVLVLTGLPAWVEAGSRLSVVIAAGAEIALDPADCQIVVDPSGSIQAAINAAANNTVICVHGGIYNEAITIPVTRTNLTLSAYPGEQPVIDGNKRIPGGLPGARFRALVEIYGSGTVLDGFEVRYSSARGLEVNANNAIVRHTAVHDNWAEGLTVRNAGENSRVTGVLIENNRVYSNLRKVRYIPVIYRGLRTGNGPTDWLFDPDEAWDNPFWTGRDVDLPEGALNALAMTFNDDGQTARIYAGSVRTTREGHIGEEFSADGTPIDYTGRDLLFFEPSTQKWTLYFKGATLGVPAAAVIDAFQIDGSIPPENLPCPQCAPIVMSFDTPISLTVDGAPTSIGSSDLVRFQPTAVGPGDVITAGAFTMERTAASMSLPAGANIDALDRTPDNRQLMSFAGDITLGGQTFRNEDLIAYDPPDAWTLYFDGSAIPFNPFSDDLTAVWLDRNGHIYISGDPIGGSGLTFVFAEDSIARGNVIYNNYGEGLVAGRYTSRLTLEDNISYDNDHANVYLNDTADVLVQRNIIYCTDDREFWRKGHAVEYRPGTGLQIRDEDFNPMPPPSTGQVIINNIVAGCSTNFGVDTQQAGGGLNNGVVANNVFINARADAPTAVDNVVFSGGTSYANSRFVNNMIVQTVPGDLTLIQGTADFSTLTVANNLYSSAPTGWFPGEVGRVVGAPVFVNGIPPLPTVASPPNPADYLVDYDSPAFDSGQTVAEVMADYFGHSRLDTGLPDIGIYELPYQGEIIIIQQAIPASAAQSFDYTATFSPAVFRLSHGQQVATGVLTAGTYRVTVGEVDGWTTTSSCDDGSTAETIALDPGETVTCTFVSTRASQLTVRNDLQPATDTPLFDFDLDGTTFQLGHESRTFVVTPGEAHAVTAAVPDGWERTAATCDNGDAPAAVTLAAGEQVNCTFSHRKLGRIVIEKQTLPDGVAQAFVFAAGYAGDGFSLSDGQQNQSDLLSPGSYAVAETLPAGWAQSSATCDDGSTPGAIALDPGETVTCVFVNAQVGLALTKTPTPGSVTAPGGDVSFAVRVSNTGAAALQLTALSDSVFGDVADAGNPALVATDCALPQSLAAGSDYTCAFTGHIGGAAGQTHHNTLTATAGALAQATAEAAVAIVAPPPGHIVIVKQTDPPNTPGQFNFSASYDADGFALGHGQSNDSGPLPSGATYSVSENVPAGWTLASATCSNGSPPGQIALAANETVTCTFTNRRTTSGPAATFYVTTASAGTVGGVAYAVGDIVAYNGLTGVWSLVFDGSDVGWKKTIGDFEFLPDGAVLLTSSAGQTVGSLKLQVHDIARFAPTSLGSTTAGTFTLYFDGSDVGLSTASERIDALARKPDGTLLISTAGRATVKNGSTSIVAQDEDLLAFHPTQLGATTSGTWNLATDGFDGSLLTGMAAENVNSAWYDGATGNLYLTVLNAFNIGSISGSQRTVLQVTPARAVSAYWSASAYGGIDGLAIAP